MLRVIFVSGIQVITREDKKADFNNPADLSGKAVGVGLGSNYEEWLTQNVPEANVSTYDDNATKLQDLLVGRLDAFLNDRLAATYLLENAGGKIVAAGEPFDKQRMGIALRKGNADLLNELNKALDELMVSKDSQINAMVALEVEDEILVERLLERGKTSGRPDDADETIIRNRIKEYYNKTAILKDYYSEQNKYFGVNGVGTIEEITERLNTVIDKL